MSSKCPRCVAFGTKCGSHIGHNKTHGECRGAQWRSREYNSWAGMKQRCYNPHAAKYPAYGARGIRVCDRWFESFEAFLADMGRCPAGFSIERKDNNGNYEKDNCVWASSLEQRHNQRVHRPRPSGLIYRPRKPGVVGHRASA